MTLKTKVFTVLMITAGILYPAHSAKGTPYPAPVLSGVPGSDLWNSHGSLARDSSSPPQPVADLQEDISGKGSASVSSKAKPALDPISLQFRISRSFAASA